MKNMPLFVFFIFLILALLTFFNNSSLPVKFITSAVQSIFSGPRSVIYGLKTDVDPESQLKRDNQKLTSKLINYQRVVRDNVALRSQFDTHETSTYTISPAKILGFSGTSQNPTSIIVDQGFKNDIHEGMAVIVKNNLIGKIGKVSENYSLVTLSTNSNFKTLAKTSDTAAAGVARGNEDFILFDRVSVSDSVNKNSFLLTSGDLTSEGIGIPPDLIIGKINSVNRSPNLPFQTAKVQFPVDFL